jgi:hypothetical protein
MWESVKTKLIIHLDNNLINKLIDQIIDNLFNLAESESNFSNNNLNIEYYLDLISVITMREKRS